MSGRLSNYGGLWIYPARADAEYIAQLAYAVACAASVNVALTNHTPYDLELHPRHLHQAAILRCSNGLQNTLGS